MNRKHYAEAITLAVVMFTLAFTPIVSQQAGTYDPWIDINDDGKIDGKDITRVAKEFGTTGTPMTKAAITYDSGWINITDKRGQYFNITPGFNLETSTWMPCIYGKTGAGKSAHQKYWYGYGMPGWNQTYGGTSSDCGYSVVETSDGGFAIAGYTNSYGVGTPNVYLVKTDADGAMVWNKTYGGTSYDEAYSVVETSDGGYAIAGRTDSFGSGYQVYLVKTYSDGAMAWNKTYGGASADFGYSVVETSDGGYAIAGFTESFGSSRQVYLVKTDGLGQIDLEWGVTIANITADALTFYRGKTDPYYNYIRVCLWVLKENP